MFNTNEKKEVKNLSLKYTTLSSEIDELQKQIESLSKSVSSKINTLQETRETDIDLKMRLMKKYQISSNKYQEIIGKILK